MRFLHVSAFLASEREHLRADRFVLRDGSINADLNNGIC